MAYKAFIVGANTLGLKYCVDDAERLQASLTSQGYDTVLAQGSKSSIQAALESIVDDAAQTDTLLLYFSGHGLLERGKLWFLVANDTSRLANKLNINECLEAFSNCRASNKLVILDCCHATQGTEDLNLDLSENYLVLAASGRLERSQEMEILGAGFFTYSLCQSLDGLLENAPNAEHGITVQELHKGMVEKAKKHNAENEGQVPIPKLLGTHTDFALSIKQNTGAASALAARVEDRHLKGVEARYRQLLLDSCDIMTLANLPEQDRHLALRPLELRRLYVPLHVWVDVKAGEDTNESEWDEIERRRLSAMGAHSMPREVRRDRERAPVGERLAKARRMVVLGDPGAGKTTLTRWIATAYLLRLKGDANWQNLPDVKTLPDADLLPIIVRCRDLSASSLSGGLDDILRHVLRKTELLANEADSLQRLLLGRISAGTALIMFDGLDEITDSGLRTRFCQHLEQIRVAYPDVPIVITSRIVGYREMGYRMGRGFEHVTLADLERGEKDDFARRWSALTQPADRQNSAARELIHDIHSADRIERLTGNPMLLTTMALVKRKVGKLPSRRADLYEEAVRVLLNWRQEVDEPLDQHEAFPQLEYLAFAMCDRGVQQLRRDEVLDLLVRMRQEFPNIHQAGNHTPEVFLDRLVGRTGLLIEAGFTRYRGLDETIYEFRHLTFQEYLAARALVYRRFPGWDAKTSLTDEISARAGRTSETAFTQGGYVEVAVVESWREALRLCVAICLDNEVDSILQAILTMRHNETVAVSRARAVLAALCIADEPSVSEGQTIEVFRALCPVIDDQDGERIQMSGVYLAAESISETRWAAAFAECLVVEYLRRDSMSRNPIGELAGYVGMRLDGSGKVHSNSWCSSQTERIRFGNESQAIRSALEVASVTKLSADEELLNELASSLLDRLAGSGPMAQAAASALESLNRADLGPGTHSQQSCVWVPTTSEIDRIAEFTKDHVHDAGAVLFLIQILERERVGESFESILSWISHPHGLVRRTVTRALANIDSERAIEYVIARLEDTDATVRGTAAEALRFERQDRVIAPLISHLGDESVGVSMAVVSALGSTQNERAVDPLIAQLKDADVDVRDAVLEALVETGSVRAIEYVISRVVDTDSEVRSAATQALGYANNELVVGPLVARLEDADRGVRIAAAQALGNMKSERAVEPLIARLGDREPMVVAWAAMALGNLQSQIAIEPLLAHIDAEQGIVSLFCIMALGQLNSEQAIEPLVAKLTTGSDSIRNAAARALGELQNERALEPLMARIGDANVSVRYSAIEALGSLRSEQAHERLRILLDDADVNTRNAAVAGLSRHLQETDRRLLSRDFDGYHNFIDPSKTVSNRRIEVAARRLKMPIEAVRARYEFLASEFKLDLGWSKSQTDESPESGQSTTL